MIDRILFLAALILLGYLGCKEKPTVEVAVASPDQEPTVQQVAKPVGDCYLALIGKDSILMQIVTENNTVAGKLHYRFYEKDKSGGTLFGNMRGDTLVADYKFMSEGMESEREVAFIRSGDNFIEGYGESIDKDGRMVFKNISSLKFEGKPMQKTDCAPVAWYFEK